MASKLFGNWKGLKKFTTNFDKDLKNESRGFLNDTSQEIKEAIQTTINGQTESWTPLKPDTIEKKGSSMILKEKGDLVNSIEVTKQSDEVYVITPQGSHHSGLSNSQIAIYHEYGTERIPPRPFISPVYEDFKDEVPKEVTEMVGKTVQKYI